MISTCFCLLVYMLNYISHWLSTSFFHFSSVSDTGDRPYKCQHCGDQFARRYAYKNFTHVFTWFWPYPPPDGCISLSDLLSRHVNKCHAGDKPPTTTAPTRRKGAHGASSTRATTSKQACDQCVMATRPCDGANPCCTYYFSRCLFRFRFLYALTF